MTKTINKNALYFRQAAHHLGEREAERHLMIAMESDCNWATGCDDDRLSVSFTWSDTPQGFLFWSAIEYAAIRDGIK